MILDGIDLWEGKRFSRDNLYLLSTKRAHSEYLFLRFTQNNLSQGI